MLYARRPGISILKKYLFCLTYKALTSILCSRLSWSIHGHPNSHCEVTWLVKDWKTLTSCCSHPATKMILSSGVLDCMTFISHQQTKKIDPQGYVLESFIFHFEKYNLYQHVWCIVKFFALWEKCHLLFHEYPAGWRIFLLKWNKTVQNMLFA